MCVCETNVGGLESVTDKPQEEPELLQTRRSACKNSEREEMSALPR